MEIIAAEPERLRVLKEHDLGVRLEYDPDGGGPYVLEAERQGWGPGHPEGRPGPYV